MDFDFSFVFGDISIDFCGGLGLFSHKCVCMVIVDAYNSQLYDIYIIFLSKDYLFATKKKKRLGVETRERD